jgi:hypothetical protein
MARNKAEQPHEPEGRPYYRHADILRYIEDGRIAIRGRAKRDAMLHFGYDEPRIIATIKNLRQADFHKTILKPLNVDFEMDVYRVELRDVGKMAYIKYGLDDRGRIQVRVMSFKEHEGN